VLTRFETANGTDLESLDLRISRRDTNATIFATTRTVSESWSVTQPLNASERNATIVVEWTATIDGEQVSGRKVLGPGADDPLPGLPDWLQASIAVISIWMTAAIFSQGNVGVGAVVTALLGGLWWVIGWLGTASTGGVVLVALAISVYVKAGDPG
jgi:hypothetical protein